MGIRRVYPFPLGGRTQLAHNSTNRFECGGNDKPGGSALRVTSLTFIVYVSPRRVRKMRTMARAVIERQARGDRHSQPASASVFRPWGVGPFPVTRLVGIYSFSPPNPSQIGWPISARKRSS